jgi:hypothetical protein
MSIVLGNNQKESTMGTLLLIVLILLLLGSFPTYPYSRKWGYGPSGIMSILLVVVLVLLLMDIVPWGWSTSPRVIGPWRRISSLEFEECIMADNEKIKDHMEVICSCGKHLGTVDHLDGDSIKLAKNDPASGGRHHWIPLEWVDHVDRKVYLNRNSEQAERDWKAEPWAMSL